MSTSKDYDKFMKEYNRLHECCPNCGVDGNYSTTLAGYLFNSDAPEGYKDKNKCTCRVCGDVHITHDRVPKKRKIMERERIKLTADELEDFDFTGGRVWVLRNEVYNFVDEIRTDEMSDGESWDIVVQRESDGKFFKWNCWNAGDHNGYIISDGDNYEIQEVFEEVISKTIYK